MKAMLDKVDQMLMNLVELASNETEKAKNNKYFSKDLAEAAGVIISLAYGRWGKND
jgi:uncharacterized membrane protein YcjF (UPF0283 family)